MAANFYGCTIPEQRADKIHLRSMEQMLEHLLALGGQPLSVARPVNKRLACRCHNFTRFLVAMLRAKRVPARSRCGFGAYFNPPYFEDHWACEYWNAAEARWILVDPQLDEVWQEKLKPDFDILDVPHDRFLTAGDAWAQCRTGKADAAKFGIVFANLRGLWFIAGNLIRDVAALNMMEMLPWDVWGAMPQPDEPIQDDQFEFFDRLAAITCTPDSSFAELRRLYEGDDRLRVPETVFNAKLNCPEAISACNRLQGRRADGPVGKRPRMVAATKLC
ncbi:MAG: transglutaminase domain-containing protein [Deltaproteobacteria bacterium]|nr:transglutaminase domain-containing protein [Deltaproteobacteria bacterium]